MQIISPCHENFTKMSKRGSGRYCGSCEKIVVDFTRMSDTEMFDYFEKHNGENICGRAKNTQLGKQNAFESFLFRARQFVADKLKITPLRMAILAILSGLMAFTTSCMGKMAEPIPRKNNYPVKDTTKSEPSKKQ